MDEAYLLKTAQALQQPSAEAAAEFTARQDALAAALNQTMLARPDLEKLIGPGNTAMMMDNSRNLCRFMANLFHGYEPAMLVKTVLWVFRTYRSHGFRVAYWPANLDTLVEVMRTELSPRTFAEVYPFFEWLIVHIPIFAALTDAQVGRMDEHEQA